MNYIKAKIKAIIFDLDGTILNTESVWYDATVDFLKEQGVNPTTKKNKEFLLSCAGISLHITAQRMKETFGLAESVEEILEKKRSITTKIFTSGIALEFIEGFEKFHKNLKTHKIPSCIATNADDVSLKHMSENRKLENFFSQHIYNISCVGYKHKPDPALFLYAAKQLGVKPEDCIIFEDSLPGLTAARAAGIRCIAIKNENNSEHLHLADESINNYHEAIEALKNMLS